MSKVSDVNVYIYISRMHTGLVRARRRERGAEQSSVVVLVLDVYRLSEYAYTVVDTSCTSIRIVDKEEGWLQVCYPLNISGHVSLSPLNPSNSAFSALIFIFILRSLDGWIHPASR